MTTTRVRAANQRTKGMSAEQPAPVMAERAFRVGEWSVDPALDQISRNTEVIKLEPRTMRLLVRLAETPGQVVSSSNCWTASGVASLSRRRPFTREYGSCGNCSVIPIQSRHTSRPCHARVIG